MVPTEVPAGQEILRLPALEVQQAPQSCLYMFAVDGKMLPRFTTVSRVRREDGVLDGYQRPEILSHVNAIRSYIESEQPMIPNAMVVAFDRRVRFEPDHSSSASNSTTRTGHLVIPIDESQADEEKPGWVVDGQQRWAAVREANVETFPVCVTAFVTEDEGKQRAQFILVNSTKPLPKGLIYELLPSTSGSLPPLLLRKKFPCLLLERLNLDEDSPFFGMIRTPTTPKGVVKDNSVLRMLENSLTDGCLYHYRHSEGMGGDVERMLKLLRDYWSAVSEVFSDAWGLSPRQSRLMHGAGIVSMGYVMDAIAEPDIDLGEAPDQDLFRHELETLRNCCQWTQGTWYFTPDTERSWNDIQNTTRDIQLLSRYLLDRYRSAVSDQGQLSV
ncbi:DGQHR domain-containing protein DpdB [Candidatus Poriferisodalis sp.]|uniref:DGQHR domain-containing protein DpdB n=1 Tax=Candidatus Poriferisodalis sp. TaxID=3101277 RepID=UPI003B52F607